MTGRKFCKIYKKKQVFQFYIPLDKGELRSLVN